VEHTILPSPCGCGMLSSLPVVPMHQQCVLTTKTFPTTTLCPLFFGEFTAIKQPHFKYKPTDRFQSSFHISWQTVEVAICCILLSAPTKWTQFFKWINYKYSLPHKILTYWIYFNLITFGCICYVAIDDHMKSEKYVVWVVTPRFIEKLRN
jgi:hypothetical protein